MLLKHNIFGGYYTLLEIFVKKVRIALWCIYNVHCWTFLTTNAQICVFSPSFQAYLSDTFLHLWSILGKHRGLLVHCTAELILLRDSCVLIRGEMTDPVPQQQQQCPRHLFTAGAGKGVRIISKYSWVGLAECLFKKAIRAVGPSQHTYQGCFSWLTSKLSCLSECLAESVLNLLTATAWPETLSRDVCAELPLL